MPQEDEKRLFFGLETKAPWPDHFPEGRLLEESHRHATLAFLGETNFSKIKEILASFPKPPFRIGLSGKFDQCLFLPERDPRVVAWHITWLENPKPLFAYQKEFIQWLQSHGFNPRNPERAWLPHVTISRKPFIVKEWRKAFTPLPCMITGLHLYESLGMSKYASLWHYPLLAPFEELEHTADIAFTIHGENLDQLYTHAQLALAFKFPPLLDFSAEEIKNNTFDDIIVNLNDLIAKADAQLGCPFKAVSFHGELKEEKNGPITWEMIVDV
jgi:2'-5' RNA ligase